MSATVQLLSETGTTLFDASSYLRVADGDGLDPYPQFEEPSFGSAPLAEGQPLQSVDEKNREMAFPLWVKGSSKDNLHALLSSVSIACQRASTLLWQDDGASAASYLDVTYARFDAAYRYWPARKAWFAGTLRVWCAPPYAHTGTARIVSTVVASQTVGHGVAYATLPAGSLAGDIGALARVKLTPGGSGLGERPLADGRVAGIAALPTGYEAFIPAASMFGLSAHATLTGKAGFPASRAIGPRDSVGGASAPLMARFALAASPYAGENRILAYARPGRPMPLALSAYDEQGNPLGATALTRGIHGPQLVDLGIARVGTLAATSVFQLAWRMPAVGDDDGAMNLYTANDRVSGMVGGLIVVPEDTLSLHVDPVERVAGRWFVGPGSEAIGPSGGMLDDYGNTYLSALGGTLALSATAGVKHSNGSGAWAVHMALPAGHQDVRHRLVAAGPSLVTNGLTAWVAAGSGAISDQPLLAVGYAPTGPSGPVLTVTHRADGISGGAITGATLALASGVPRGASHGLVVDLVKSGDGAHALIRQCNADSISFFSGGAIVSDTVASVGFTDADLRSWRAQQTYVYSYGGWSWMQGHFLDALGAGQPVPSDALIFDEGAIGAEPHRTSGLGSAPHPLELRGAQVQLDPQAAKVCAFSAGIDGLRQTHPLAVEVRVRERFRFTRG